MRRGATKYTLLDGLPELKEAIQTKFRRDSDLEYAPAEIIASAGAKQVFYNAMGREPGSRRRGHHPRPVLDDVPGYRGALPKA